MNEKCKFPQKLKNNDYQVNRAYLTHAETGGEEANERAKISFAAASRCFVKRKLGQTPMDKIKPEPKRRRGKTYQMVMQMDNMLRGINKKLADFHIGCVDGKYSIEDPFQWPSLNMSPDRGADMVCADHFLSYDKNLNLTCDYDPSHDAKNVGRGTLKECGQWSHQVTTPNSLKTSHP